MIQFWIPNRMATGTLKEGESRKAGDVLEGSGTESLAASDLLLRATNQWTVGPYIKIELWIT